MDDLISRQAAIEAIRKLDDYTNTLYAFAIGSAITALKELPVSQKRKKGEWIHDGYDFPHGNDWIHCSICGKRGINVPADLTNFCPNCGADMREE